MTGSDRRVRKSDGALRGLIVFLFAVQLATLYVGFTAISRQSRATCYQLISVEAGAQREQVLADHTTGDVHDTHVKSVAGLKVYAAGLRSIVPGCPAPRKHVTR